MVRSVNDPATNPPVTRAVFFFFLSAENRLLPTEVRKEALQLQKLLEYDDEGAEGQCCYFLLLSAASVFIPFCLIINVLIFTLISWVLSVQVSAHTWMMSINGLESKIPKSWSPHPETPAPDSKCFPRSGQFLCNEWLSQESGWTSRLSE